MPTIPSDTFAAARHIFNIQHVYLQIGDQLAGIVAGVDLSALDAGSSMEMDTVLRLALVTAFQYAELMADPLAADATLKRMDWKYALHLPINYPGLSSHRLFEFRRQLCGSPRGLAAYSVLLERLSLSGLFSRRKRLQLEPNSVLATVCMITRLFQLDQAMREVLSLLGTQYPDWLRANALPYWYDRYNASPLAKKSATGSLVDPLDEGNTLGNDVRHLLDALLASNSALADRHAEIRRLAELFKQQYDASPEGSPSTPAFRCSKMMCGRQAFADQ